ncbi:MAG TPA: carbohydrate binding family 9 domain-containing protein, partial [Pyrinomonadaceae bacterium]|nr:carbohydrate binding family 9 domain-containing protein [Pyrinomonadaceae bacterium]
AQNNTPAVTAPPQTTQTVQPAPSPAAREPEALTANVKNTGESSGAHSRYTPKTAPARIPRFDTPPVIDGQLNDAIWQTAAVFGEFLQTNPGDNTKPTHPTEFLMGYDAKNLYMAFRVVQDRDKVRATVARRDNIFNDDYVLVHLDTFNDQRQAYLLFFNPLGIQADGTFTEGRGEDYSLDIIMESKGILTEDGFTIEVAIPFKSLRYEAGKNKLWGLHINRRVKYNNNEYNSWMPTNRGVSGWLNQAGHITGLEGIETTRQLEINPSFTLSESGRRTRFTFDGNPGGRFVNDGLKGDFGMTAKFSLTPTITLDFAYNPDFAQVEADAPVSTANVRFPIFFPEKRPFFLERIDIFQSGLNIVNTRAIVDPDIAAKLTGRRGKNTFGLMYASDNAPGNYSQDERESLLICQREQLTDPTRICSIERFVDKNADIAVLRLKRDVGRQHNVGFFATTYNFPDLHNHTAGFDGRFRLSQKTVTEFQVVGTNSRRCLFNADFEPAVNTGQAQYNRNRCGSSFNEYRTGNGVGYRVYLERADRNLYMNYVANGRSKDYRANVGFTSRVDTNYLGSFIRYQTDRDAKKPIIFKRLFNETNISYDWDGRSQSIRSNTQGMLSLQRQFYVGGGGEYGYERVLEHEFGPKRTPRRGGTFFGPDSERSAHRREIYGFVEATPYKQLFFLLVLSHSVGNIDYDFGAGPKFPRVSAPYLAWQEQCAGIADCPFAEPALDPGAGDQLFIESSIRYQPTSAWQMQLNYTRRRLTRHDTGLVA